MRMTDMKVAKLSLDLGLDLGRVWTQDDNDVPNNDVLLFEGTENEAKQIYQILLAVFKAFEENRG